jgi:hypothetical protein
MRALDPKQSNSFVQTLVTWVWAEEVMWHRSSMEVMGSWTGEFLDPPPPDTPHKVKTLGPDSSQ